MTARLVHDSHSRLITSDATDPAAGGMAHHYLIEIPVADARGNMAVEIEFQHGPIREVGVNGMQHADLYRVLIDRLTCAQAGPFACDENGRQLDLLQEALRIDEARTARRQAAGTEGRNIGT
jgi:hypothetical protein